MTTISPDPARAAVLDWLWNRVIGRVGAMRLDRTGPAYDVGEDDHAMRTATPEEGFGWIDDCEARLGCDVADARAALVDYFAVRDGIDADLADVLADAWAEAQATLDESDPARTGLRDLLPA